MDIPENQPLISVIIPTYNRAEIVGRTLDSALNQSFGKLEIIVVDDGSTDHTEEALKPYNGKIRYVKQENAGVSAARNTGLKLANGEYIAFLDSDDIWLADKLDAQVRFLQKHSVHMVITDSLLVGGEDSGQTYFQKSLFPGLLMEKDRVIPAFPMLLVQNFIHLSSVLVHKQCLEKAGVFDESLKVAEDTDLWIRLSVHYPIGVLHRVFAQRHKQGDNLSDDKTMALEGRIVIFDKLFANRDAVEKIGTKKISEQKQRVQGALLYHHLKNRNVKGIFSVLSSSFPFYLCSKIFYKAFYWELKKNQKDGLYKYE